MSMTTEEMDFERDRRKDDQRSEALQVAARLLHGSSAEQVIKAATEFHKFLTGV